MKPTVVIDSSPLSSAHQGRGVGTYTRNLIAAVKAAPSPFTVTASPHPSTLKADLIHYPYFDLFFHTLPLYQPGKTVVTIHDLIPLIYPDHFKKGLKGTIKLALQRQSLNSVNHIITDSAASKRDIVKFFRLPSQQITVIPLAAGAQIHQVSLTAQTRLRQHHHLQDRFIAYVGDINYNKNLPATIQAVAKLNHLQLVIATRASLDQNIPEVLAIKRELDKLPSPDLVKFIHLNSAGELSAFYSAADWYIQPSLYEGFGLPVLEAMQVGTPVLCSSASSLPEVAGEAAVYFSPVSSDKIFQALTQAINFNKTQKDKLVRLGLIQAQEFSWEQTAARTIGVYQQVLNRP